jgi:fimbrial chaperone protein
VVALFVFAAGALAGTPADAGTFQVSPVRIELGSGAPSGALTVRNDGPDSVVVQMSVLKWTQAGNADRYEPTTEALVTPPIATIPPGAEQLVRVGLRRGPDPRQEVAYRLYVQEVPPPPQPGFSGLQMALRIGVPVFVAPLLPAERSLAWKVRLGDDGSLVVSATNAGTANAQVQSVAARAVEGPRAWIADHALTYVLAGSERSWKLAPEGGSPASPPARVVVKALTDAGDVEVSVAIAR